MDFVAKLDERRIWTAILDGAETMTPEVNFDCSRVGIRVSGMDSSHVAFVNLLLKRESFSQWNLPGERTMKIGINLKNMSDLLACGSTESSVLMTAAPNGDDVTYDMFDPETRESASFTLAQLDLDQEGLAVPDAPFFAQISLPTQRVEKLLKDMSTRLKSKIVTIEVYSTHVMLKGQSDTVRRGGFKLPTTPELDPADPARLDIVLSPEAFAIHQRQLAAVAGAAGAGAGANAQQQAEQPLISQTFALRYFIEFLKSKGLNKRLVIGMRRDAATGFDLPICFRFVIDAHLSFCEYLLAPKIEEDDGGMEE